VIPRMLLIVLIPLLLNGCVQQASQPPLAANDPANPHAPEAPPPERSQTLATLEAAPPATMAVPSQQLMPDMHRNMPGMSHDMGRDMGDMKGMQHQAPATMPGDNAALSAPRWTPTTVPATRPSSAPTVYTCRMHPQVLSNVPGKCPICAMTLIPKASTQKPAHDHTGHGDKGEHP
jgi:hypothetical protein